MSKASIFGQVKVLPQKPHSKTASRHLSCKSEETKESTATGNPIEPSKSSNLASTIKRKTEEFVSNLKVSCHVQNISLSDRHFFFSGNI